MGAGLWQCCGDGGGDEGCSEAYCPSLAPMGSPRRCKVCPLTFFTKSEMQIHSKSHTEAKPHKCPHCSKSFANASYLAQHLRIHLGVKPYHCSYCEKSFRQLSHLQQHTRCREGLRGVGGPRWGGVGCDRVGCPLSTLCHRPLLGHLQLRSPTRAALLGLGPGSPSILCPVTGSLLCAGFRAVGVPSRAGATA